MRIFKLKLVVLIGCPMDRSVHISYKVSGETCGIVWKRPEHEWRTFVNALHYFAARRCGVPVWCVELLWKYDPWEEAQLPMNLYIQCDISFVFDIAEGTDETKRCCNCWEDCEDTEERYAHVLVQYWRGGRDPRDWNCDTCCPQHLCDLCHVDLPGGGSSCLNCFAPRRERPETDKDYLARVAPIALAGLTEAQLNRWLCVRADQYADRY